MQSAPLDLNQLMQQLNSTSATIDMLLKKTLGTANVLDFNAKGDGKTDDTPAINRAIDSLPNGGIVTIPAGLTYMIQGWTTGSKPDNPTGGIKLKSNITLIMYGATLKVIPNNKDDYACINVTKVSNVRIYGGKLIGERNQHIDSGNPIAQWGYGIAVIGSTDVYIDGVFARDFFGDGFYIGASSDNWIPANVNMQYCIADNNRRQGLSITSCYTGNILFNTFKGTNGMSPEAGIDVEPNPGRYVSNVNIRHNFCVNNNGFGILFASIQEDTPTGKNCVIESNHCLYNKLNGIHANKSDNNTFQSNVCLENGGNGLFFQNTTNTKILDNTSKNNVYSGLMVGDSSDNTIDGNTCLENSQEVNNKHDNIILFNSHDNFLQNNKVRKGNTTKKPRYGMYVANDCTGNVLSNNDVSNGGQSAALNVSAGNSIGVGNKCAKPTLWSTQTFIAN